MTDPRRLHIDRDALARTELRPDPDAPGQRPLQAGEVRLAVDRFALTANNVTYAAFGRAMRYWDFFPARDPAWGCLPVWGFATVADSRLDGDAATGFACGRRVYGYLPAGTHLVVRPGPGGGRGFEDLAPHRRGLAAVYNHYRWCDRDPAWTPDGEGLQAVLQPLYTTAFLLDDFLAGNAFFGARQLLLSSASSKTSLATAHALSLRRGDAGHPRVIGLTSPAHAAFVQALGGYDEVWPYEALESRADATTPAVYVDFSGSAEWRARVHRHFGDALTFSSAIGGTHWQDLGSGSGLPGPRPVLFFAPAQAARRQAAPPDGWGAAQLADRIGAGWRGFLARVRRDADNPWVEIATVDGAEALDAAFRRALTGGSDPRQGLMVKMDGG